MEIKFKGKSGKKYKFYGPYTTTEKILNRSGVYVVLCNGKKIVDIREASEVKKRIEFHERIKCWKKHCKGTISFAVHYIKHGKKTFKSRSRTGY